MYSIVIHYRINQFFLGIWQGLITIYTPCDERRDSISGSTCLSDNNRYRILIVQRILQNIYESHELVDKSPSSVTLDSRLLDDEAKFDLIQCFKDAKVIEGYADLHYWASVVEVTG